jgi:hypothetical protein
VKYQVIHTPIVTMNNFADFLRNGFRGEVQTLTEDEKKLFNGYDELGGDVVKYDQTAEFYNDSNNQFLLSVAGISALEKPAPWIFSGNSNQNCKELVKKVSELEDICKIDNLTESGIKLKKDMFFEKLNDVDYDLEGNKLTIEFKDPKSMDSGLCNVLPLFTDQEIRSMTEDDIVKMRSVRAFWKGNFKLVNLSKLKRIGLMYLEMRGRNNLTRAAYQFYKKRGGAPTNMRNFGSNDESKRIMKSIIENFTKDKKYWIQYKDTFSEDFTREDLEDRNYSETQESFIRAMTLSIVIPDEFTDKCDIA